jgi:hypothetical protein
MSSEEEKIAFPTGHGIQICFCAGDGKALPVFPLEAHDPICLVWDWAAANGKITPQQHLAKLEEAATGLGLTAEDFAEAAGGREPPTFALFRDAPSPCCYKAPAGFMVHVKPGCRCRSA